MEDMRHSMRRLRRRNRTSIQVSRRTVSISLVDRYSNPREDIKIRM